MNDAYRTYLRLKKEYHNLITDSDLRWIIEECANCTYSKLLTEETLSLNETKLKFLLNETKSGKPLAYTLGYCKFLGMTLKVNEHTLIPRNETEELVILTLHKLKAFSAIKFVDVGTGSGNIALALEQNLPNSIEGYAIDISSKALAVAKMNAEKYQSHIQFILGDALTPILALNKKFNLIISNPPYIAKGSFVEPSVDLFEPHEALYAEDKGLAILNKIIKMAPEVVDEHFVIALEISPEQTDALKNIISQTFMDVEYEFVKDMNGFIRFLFIQNYIVGEDRRR